jgi:hypothetical protein
MEIMENNGNNGNKWKQWKQNGNNGNNGQFASVPQLIETYGEWVQSLFDDGFRMYLVTLKFNPYSRIKRILSGGRC